MNFIHERVINSPGSPNHGVIVRIDDDLPGWNPKDDSIDPAYVTAMMPDGRLGSIRRDALWIPPTNDLGEVKHG